VSVIERIVGKGEYILKGRGEDGRWVEITRYDRRVTWADVSEEFEEDLCEKYDTIMLYNKAKRKPEWVKNCKPPIHRFTSTTQAMASAFNTFINMLSMAMTTMIQTQNTMLQMMNQMMSNRPSLADQLTEAFQMIKVAKLLAGEAKGGGGGGDELDRILALIDRLRGLQAQVPQSSTPQPQTQTQSRELPPELKQKLEEVDKELESTYEEMGKELEEALAICKEVEGEECEPETT
jgi:flagellar hook-basal body complex protein FliE